MIEYYRIQLSSIEAALLERRITGTGGMQDLMLALQQKYRESDRTILLSDEDIEKIKRYYHKYGHSGGYQERLGALVRCISAQTDMSVKALDEYGFKV